MADTMDTALKKVDLNASDAVAVAAAASETTNDPLLLDLSSFSPLAPHATRTVRTAGTTDVSSSFPLPPSRTARLLLPNQTDGDDVAPLSRLGPTSGFLGQVTAFGHLTTDVLEI